MDPVQFLMSMFMPQGEQDKSAGGKPKPAGLQGLEDEPDDGLRGRDGQLMVNPNHPRYAGSSLWNIIGL